ncbi:hypothetical protein LCGC14_1934930 [marine sediment metagenome]|uniref:Nuclease associated modular domain-containing protein n=1 Tax=marine sediment metagenome TaxID=412755 RepID=A0A0F9FMF3_9ZZZZ
MSKKKTKTVKVTCKECGREIRVSKGSRCHLTELCYSCIGNKKVTKVCTKCGLVKKQSEFYRDKSRKDGLHCWCKSCRKKSEQSGVGRESSRIRGRAWYLKNKQLTVNRAVQWAKDSPKRRAEILAKSNKRRRAKHPEKSKAHSAVQHALRTGRLTKEPCFCGETEVEGHHEDYNKPLDVIWLCRKCHLYKHKKKDWIIT